MFIRALCVATALCWAVFFAALPSRGDMMLTGAGSAGKVASGPSSTTLDPANTGSGGALSGGNLTFTYVSAAANSRSLTSHTTGKYYFESTLGASVGVGVDTGPGLLNASQANNSGIGSTVDSLGIPTGDGCSYTGGHCAQTGTPPAAGNVVSVAVDLGAQVMWFSVSCGGWSGNGGPGTGDPATNTGGRDISTITGAIFAAAQVGSNTNSIVTMNFGGTSYACTPPSGFGSW